MLEFNGARRSYAPPRSSSGSLALCADAPRLIPAERFVCRSRRASPCHGVIRTPVELALFLTIGEGTGGLVLIFKKHWSERQDLIVNRRDI
jgi:hypothetical protein